jgi:hypothetical protein
MAILSEAIRTGSGGAGAAAAAAGAAAAAADRNNRRDKDLSVIEFSFFYKSVATSGSLPLG